MLWLSTAALLAAAYPVGRAWWANRRTALRQAATWAAGAWAAWLLLFAGRALGHGAEAAPGRPLALALTACAGVAVLGARRPGAGAWNFVVCGLLAVLLLPVAEGLGRPRRAAAPEAFLAATLAVGLFNYLPTRLGAAALLLGAGCALEFTGEAGPAQEAAAGLCLALAPWAGLALARRRGAAGGEFDALWLDFRDRFGAVWGLRIREQFNRAAANAGWPLVLRWEGLATTEGAAPPQTDEPLKTLRALLRRFGPEEDGG